LPPDAGLVATDGAADAAVDAPTPFTPVSPPADPLPAENNGGRLIATPSIVFLSYAGDPNAAAMASFLSWLPTSTYFASTLGEYGISAGTFAGSHMFGTTVPTSYALDQFMADVDAKIANGQLGAATSSSVYALLAPAGLQISDGFGSITCQDYVGFHMLTPAGHPVAVVFTCPGETFDDQTSAMSHEVAEMVTDPGLGSSTAWDLLYMGVFGGEIGDLCNNTNTVQDGHTVQRMFSNAAAAASQDPCVPADPTIGYLGVAPTDGTQPGAAAGTSVTTHWKAFATQRPPGPMRFFVDSDPALHVTVSPCTGNVSSGCAVDPGDAFTIDIAVSPDTLPGYREVVVFTAAGSQWVAQWNLRVATAPQACDALTQNCPSGEGCQRWFNSINDQALGGCVSAGNGGPGATCNANNDCAPGLECNGVCTAYCGVCDPANPNDPCSFASTYQATATYCDPHGANPTFCTQVLGDPDVNDNLEPTHIVCAPGCDIYNPSTCTDLFGRSGGCYHEYAGLTCAPAGSTPIGGSCTYVNDCAPGGECLGTGQCYATCKVAAPSCPTGSPCIDLNDANVPGLGACMPPCDIFHASSCTDVFGNAGACYYESRGLACEASIGTIAIGASCTYANDCVPGAMCLDSPGTCYQVCRVGAANACPVGKTCYDLQDPKAPGLGACG
jgi:hypothetical protein